MDRTTRALAIVTALKAEYPDLRPLLDFRNPFELLIAVILSAQTTDAQVNQITPALFRRFPCPEDLAGAEVAEIELLVHSTGFFRTKARNIRGAAGAIVEKHAGQVPDSMEELVALPGVGRKSANVILSHIYGVPGIIVDTHFSRVVRRLGLTAEKEPERIERDVDTFLPENVQTDFSMAVNYHGRYCCTARSPACHRCVVATLCEFSPKNLERPPKLEKQT
ncbi:MAG TPA: endonuclease III [Spirochaetia bacterium]|nr:endonuclease III [Spirochaetia bacterium]